MKIPPEPIIVSHLFPEVRAELLRVLTSLSDEQWNAPTACAGWSVRDVAAHILADDVGLLSSHRDHDGQHFNVNNYAELLTLINAQNDRWVQSARRISRRLLCAFLELTGTQWQDFVVTIDPFSLGGPIGWKGSQPDPMWIHIARELTEFWMHHQHICEAAGISSLKEARYVHPVLSTFAHAFPHTYRDTDAPADTLVKIVLTGAGGGTWHVLREAGGWTLYAETDLSPASSVTMPADTAWRMFTKGIAPDVLRQQTLIEGQRALGEVALNTVAIIA
ncbi:MAG: maleylpyruvate isomerase family mycothiol-dependent enzyme [Anaerolineae bacterium]